MDVLNFYNGTKKKQTDKDKIKLFLKHNVNEKIISLSDYEYCVNYINSEMTLFNSKQFDEIMNKIDKNPKQIKTIIDYHNYNKLYDLMKKERGEIITFNEERENVIKKIFNVLYDYELKLFGMYGYAGTGKTTLILEIIQFLIIHKQLKSVVFSAPTHKALNVLKINFSKIIPNLLSSLNIPNQNNFESNLREISMAGVIVEFKTIHSLLCFTMDFNSEGNKCFIKKQKYNSKCTQTNDDDVMTKYEMIIIDECSMISLPMIIELFEEIHKQMRSCDGSKSPKIIFTGDPAQLPPVNEKSSPIFIKSKEDIQFSEYLLYINNNQNNFMTQEIIKKNYEQLTNDLSKMETITLTQIFRNNRSNVINTCYNIRQWIFSEIDHPSIRKYIGNGVFLYNSKNTKGKKLQTEWFQKCIEEFKSNVKSNIILTWTNEQSNIYNNEIRKKLLGKKDIEKFEVGDVLILNDFYSFDDNEQKNNDDDSTRFYTSEQIKILTIEEEEKLCGELQIKIPSIIEKNVDATNIIRKYKYTITKINKFSERKYKVWKFKVARLGEYGLNNNNNESIIRVIHETSAKQLIEDNEMIIKLIRILTKSYQNNNNQCFKSIEKTLLKPLWIHLNRYYIAPFAKVTFGFSITTHKAQGSTFDNVFIDALDILKNQNNDEVKRCIYTAYTRCANELHILI